MFSGLLHKILYCVHVVNVSIDKHITKTLQINHAGMNK